jgi:hypothetical protein
MYLIKFKRFLIAKNLLLLVRGKAKAEFNGISYLVFVRNAGIVLILYLMLDDNLSLTKPLVCITYPNLGLITDMLEVSPENQTDRFR